MFRAIFEFTNMRAIVTVLDEFYDNSDFYHSRAEYNVSEWGNAEWNGDSKCDRGQAEYNVSEWGDSEWSGGRKRDRNRAEYNVSEWSNAEWNGDRNRAEYNVSEWSNAEWNGYNLRNRAEYNVSEWSYAEWSGYNRDENRAEYNVSEWGNADWSAGGNGESNEEGCNVPVSYLVPNATANLCALFYYVNMRATYDLVSPNFDGDNVGGSRFDSRAIAEWTLNG